MSTKPVNVEEYRIRAQRRLPKIIFDYLEGGADDEIGMKHNREVFDRYRLMLGSGCPAITRSEWSALRIASSAGCSRPIRRNSQPMFQLEQRSRNCCPIR